MIHHCLFKATFLFAIALGSLSQMGCKRAVCDPVPLDGFWTAHKEIIPPGATICKVGKSGDAPRLDIDFADDPNPFVTIVQHAESKGFARTEQKIDNPDFQSMMLGKGKGADLAIVAVSLSREGGRYHGSFTWEGKQ